jgi:replicative DNA helicase
MENVQFNTKNRSGKGNVISLEKGKLPPQALDLEEAVLGAMMIDKEAIDTVIDILHPDVFYKEAHQHIYKAIFTLFQTSQPADLLTVSEQLKKDGNLEAAGGDYYLIHLTQKVASTAHVEYHARIVLEKYIKRSLIRISGKIEEESFDETSDVFDVLDGAEAKLFEISQGNLKKSSEDAQTLVSQAIKHIEEISKKEGMSGVPSGFEKVDAITSGWQNSDLIVIAARPGMGKCLGKGTKVLMYDGTLKKVEDIQVGELIMGNDSTPRTVLSLARGREKMYWVHQNKAISYRVNESHILSLKRSRNEGKHQHGDVLNISIQEYLNKSSKFKSNYKGYKTAVSFDKKETDFISLFFGLMAWRWTFL